MAHQRLIEGAAVTPAMGYRSTCRQDGCDWDARDVSKFQVNIARIHHEHPTFAPTYRNISEDTIARRNDDARSCTVTVSVERVTWEVPFVENKGRRTHEHGANALVVGSAVITDPRDDKTFPRVGRHSTLFGPAPALWDLHLASGDDRLRFVEMAPAIVEAFRRLAEMQAEEYAKCAEAVSRTVVR